MKKEDDITFEELREELLSMHAQIQKRILNEQHLKLLREARSAVPPIGWRKISQFAKKHNWPVVDKETLSKKYREIT